MIVPPEKFRPRDNMRRLGPLGIGYRPCADCGLFVWEKDSHDCKEREEE